MSKPQIGVHFYTCRRSASAHVYINVSFESGNKYNYQNPRLVIIFTQVDAVRRPSRRSASAILTQCVGMCIYKWSFENIINKVCQYCIFSQSQHSQGRGGISHIPTVFNICSRPRGSHNSVPSHRIEMVAGGSFASASRPTSSSGGSIGVSALVTEM